jgi:hypothetical protein
MEDRERRAEYEAGVFCGSGGTVRFALLADINTLKGDAEFQIGVQSGGTKTPPVKMVFAGPLAGIVSAPGQLDAGEAERYIAMKRMEGTMDRLEKISQTGQLPPVTAAAQTAGPAQRQPPRLQKGLAAIPWKRGFRHATGGAGPGRRARAARAAGTP